jgi:hypothetical protein
MSKTFSPTSEMADRAVQAWQILVCKAMNRQTLTYLELSRLMYGKDAAGTLDKILGHVAYFCNANALPPLTSIVVGKGRGTPGHDIPADLSKIDAARERVYEFDWYDVFPPSRDDLRTAYEANV